MNLYFVIPNNPGKFNYWYILEVILIIISYVIITIWIFMTPKLRLHIHLKIYINFIYASFIAFVSTRLIVLGYLNGYIRGDKEVPLEKNPLIVLCALTRMFYHGSILTITVIVAVERELSLRYAEDYECTLRPWIPIFLTGLSIVFGGSVAIGSVFEIVPFLPGMILFLIVVELGLVAYLYGFRKAWKLNHALKRRLPCHLKYSLSVRYQLEENIWFSEVLITAQVILCIGFSVIAVLFILANIPSFSYEMRELFDLAYHITADGGALLVAFATFIRNKYMIGILKGLFFNAEVEPEIDDGDFYFDQLLVQWEGPIVDLERTKKNRTFLMWLLRLHE